MFGSSNRIFYHHWRVCVAFSSSNCILQLTPNFSIFGPTKELGIQQEITNLTVTMFVMGFGIGYVEKKDLRLIPC